jgi:hypothetical protein
MEIYFSRLAGDKKNCKAAMMDEAAIREYLKQF